MTPELWQRLKPLYSAALDLPQEGRTSFIEQMCGSDAELARELRALIDANQSAAHTLDPPLAGFSLFPPLRNATLEPGTVLADRFRIVRHLGSGGMGDVYEAVDLQLEQGRIALKTLRPEIAGNPNALGRFKEEVLLARKITGPNICRIHELYLTGSHQHAMPVAFLTMELLEGITLHDHIEQGSPLPVAEIRLLAGQLCSALGCIHEAGIIHRDLKTRNVMLVPHGGGQKIVVMDFGLALVSSPARGGASESLQESAFVAGTPSYMAPEQFEGREAGPPTDIYALGLILYEMATGVQPFAAHTPLAAAIRRSQRPRFVSSFRHELPPAWDDIIQRCMEYDPARRFQSAGEVMEALKHPGKVVLRFGKERRIAVPRAALFSAGTVVLGLMCAVTWFWVRSAQQRRLTPEAAHWYAMGTTALREGSYLKATRLLTEVTRRDPTYAVAHAALADAWSELDYTDQAQREMLLASAPEEQKGLRDVDRRYIDAVRTTIVRDYSAAAQDYEAILNKDPEDRKADGYVDLGRIYEKAGKMQETVAAYEHAAQLNPDDPAPFLHLGILRSKLRQTAEANTAFDRAESLYRAESDLEGLAEMAYQRGYAANESGAPAKAETYLQRSLALARQIPSEQLEARTLSQLSSVSYWENKDDVANTYANRAIEIARANRLEYWSTDGLVRLANVDLDREDYPAAEQLAQQALNLAQSNGHPRLEASAQLTLASIRNQQKRFDESIALAQSALQYYQDYGFLDAADKAETLILRVERARGDYVQALQAGHKLIDIATRTHSTMSVAIAEELVGGILLRLQRYPEALGQFEAALRATESLGQSPAYQQSHCAEVLWRLGRYGEAEKSLGEISPEMLKRRDIGSSVASIRADMEASQGRGREALRLAREEQSRFAELRDDPDLDRTIVSAELETGEKEQAHSDLARLLSLERATAPQAEVAQDHLLQAQLALQSNDPVSARSLAEAAEQVFCAKDIQESCALSAYWAASAAAKQGDAAGASAAAQKSVDFFRHLSQSWGVPAFQTYLQRPDRQQIMATLRQLLGPHGDLPDELSR